MDRRDLSDLIAFEAVANSGSFTRAAARLGRAQSGLSQTITDLEARLGATLFARTTRSVRLTDAGQRLYEIVSPALRQISDGLEQTKIKSEDITGTVRLSMTEDAAVRIVLPNLPAFLESNPGIHVDISADDRLADIVAEDFDAGIRYGANLELDMIAVPLGPDLPAVIVGSPSYFKRNGVPRDVDDLKGHDCINIRTQSHGDLFHWRLQKGQRAIDVPVPGRVILNGTQAIMSAAVSGLGLAYTFEPLVAEHVNAGRLQTCLRRYCPIWPGYHLYYPSRRQKSKPLGKLIEHLQKNSSQR